jgi:hypothetical protein
MAEVGTAIATAIETVIEAAIGIKAVMETEVMTAIVIATGRTSVIRFRSTTTRSVISPETTPKLARPILIR